MLPSNDILLLKVPSKGMSLYLLPLNEIWEKVDKGSIFNCLISFSTRNSIFDSLFEDFEFMSPIFKFSTFEETI